MSSILEAKRSLPLPVLMNQLGDGEHAKRSAFCPFHEDHHKSFSVFETEGGWFFKCHAGCGEGDEITYLEKRQKIPNRDAIKLYLKWVEANGYAGHVSNISTAKRSNSAAITFNWQACVEAFTEKDQERLAEWRGYSDSFVELLHQRALLGLYDGCVAFPVHYRGEVVAAHYRVDRGTEKPDWFYFPKLKEIGLTIQPLVIGGIANAKVVHVFESQWDAFAVADKLALHEQKTVALLATRGASNGKLVAGLIPREATVFAWPQNDAPDQKWLKAVATHANVPVQVVTTPERFKDVNEWTLAGATADELEGALDRGEAWVDVDEPGSKSLSGSEEVSERLNSSKPKVELPGDGRLLSTFATELAGILKDHSIYQRGGLAFIVNRQRDGLEVVTAQMLRTLAEQHLVCFRIKRVGGNELSLVRTMSEGDAQGVLCAQQFLSCLPQVEKVATARLPVMREDGAIELLPKGYDRESLTLTMPKCDYDESLQLATARQIVDELLCEFPFADTGRSRAVAVSAMVGLFAAGLVPKAALRPVFIYLANAEGAGKTMLAKCAISPVHGLVKTDGDLKDKAESSKELLAAVMEARPYILFDNCKKHLDSSYLEAFATSVLWSGRVLGVSKTFCGENNVAVFITGNSCTVSPDMRRRSLFIELFMEDERAEDRKFKRELDETALLAMRVDILAALWAFVREWDAAGRPKPSRTHSSFSRWAEIIGGIVEFAGYGCPLETAEILSASDVDGTEMRELVKLLADGEPVRFEELTELARKHGLFERIIGGDGELKPADKSAFGKLLARYDRRVFGGCIRFVVEGKGHSRRFHAVTEDAGLHGQHGQHGVSVHQRKTYLP